MREWQATWLLVGVTAVWGWTFTLVRDAVAAWGVMGFLALRFAIAAAAVTALWGWRLRRDALAPGAGLGAVLAAGYLLQTWGLRYTTPTNSGLITGLFVVIAPLLDRALHGTAVPRTTRWAVGLSFAGTAALSGTGTAPLNLGDLLTLGCAAAFGLHIALLARHAPRHDPQALTVGQMLTCAALFLAAWPATEPVGPPPRTVWFALALTGLVASALAFFVQTAVQRHLSAARTAVILTMEPVFAAAFGHLLAGDRLVPTQLAGGAAIVAALYLAQRPPRTTAA